VSEKNHKAKAGAQASGKAQFTRAAARDLTPFEKIRTAAIFHRPHWNAVTHLGANCI
jgi:hypothetical protein